MKELTITVEEVKAQLKALNITKAAGPDELHPTTMKPLAEFLAFPLAEMYERSLKEARFP